MKFKLVSDGSRCLTINQDRVNAYASRWKPGTEYTLEVTRKVPRRSDPMRKYFFAAVLPPFCKELGYEVDEQELLHRQMKIVYFKCEPDSRGIYRNVPSVFSDDSNMPVPQKKEYLDWVVRKAAIAGVYIPDPGEAT